MNGVGDLLRAVNAVAFCVIAMACAVRWRKQRDASNRWATLAFASLAAVGVIGFVMRLQPSTHLAGWFVKIILVVLILFPFFLYRFATAFQPPPRLIAIAAHVSTGLVVLASVSLPHLPVPGAPDPPLWWSAYRFGILAQWTLLFSIVASRLWIAARHEASVVRRRMRTLALAAAGLNGVVLLSGVGTASRSVTMASMMHGLSLVSAVLFFVGLAPPAWLVQLWRRPEQLAFQAAMGALFRAETQAELSAVLLPRAVGLVGARGGVLMARSGEILGSYGSIAAELDAIEADRSLAAQPSPGMHRVTLGSGTLLLWTSHYAPFFGRDEFAMIESLGVFADIVMDRCALVNQRREAEEALTHQATHDDLTGLPNRVLLEVRVTQALATSRRTGTRVAALFLDVDRFKVINDSLGHSVGDQLLKALAQRLQAIMRPEDTIARFGGDEFVIVTEARVTDDATTMLPARISKALCEPVCIDGTNINATVSVGVAVATATHDAGSLLRDADAAMYQAKEQGRNRCVYFDSDMREAANRRLETERALRRALDGGELRVHYQPMVELASGRVAGVEALVRWQKDKDTLILPNDFIPVAEETGLIVQLGETVLREACRQVAEWHREIPQLGQLSLSVNLSACELLNPGLVDQVRDAVHSSGLDPGMLCLEITESVLLEDAESCARSLRMLNALGVRIGVDDFGTGYSSLTYLKRLAVDILKIDRSFVEGLDIGTPTRKDRAIVSGVVDLAHAFGLTTIAEGVETAEQVAQLNTLGCGIAQGFYFCPALPAAGAAQWIQRKEAGAAAVTVDNAPEGFAGCTRVLVVDDEGSLRNLFRWTLEGDPQFRVVAEAPDGRQAVALARHHQPDLVLLDLAMPGLGGLEALPLIRAVAPDTRVVVLSGLDAADVADRARVHGAAGFLAKGGDPEALLADLRGILASSSRTAESVS